MFRWLVSRADPLARTEGALLAPLAIGRTASGGYLDRKEPPAAGAIGLSRTCFAILAGWTVTVRTRSRRV